MRSFKTHIAETIHPSGTEVVFSHKGKMTSGKVVRYEKGSIFGGSPFYVVDHGEYASAKVPAHKIGKYTTFHEDVGAQWIPATKTVQHYEGQINNKTFVVPHASTEEPMRHAIVTSLHHVQHNNPDLSPEEVTRVHQHIKDLHGGQEGSKLKESHDEENPPTAKLYFGPITKTKSITYNSFGKVVKPSQGPTKTMTTKARNLKEDHMIQERQLTASESEKKEDIVHGMKKKLQGFKARYGKDAKSVMYATATARAKDLAEEGADALKRPFRKHRMQETNPFKVGDKVKLHPEALKHHAQSVPAHAGYSKEGFAWREHLGKLEGHMGTVSRVFDSGHTNVDFHSGTIGIHHKSLVPHHDPKKLDELSNSTLGSYVKKSSTDIANHAYHMGADRHKTFSKGSPSWKTTQHKTHELRAQQILKRRKGLSTAVGKLTKEEVEQLDELKRSTLKNYIKKAVPDIITQGHKAMEFNRKASLATTEVGRRTYDNASSSAYNRQFNRIAGVDSAVSRLEEEHLTEVNLGLGDHRVIKSFLNGEKAEGKKLSTDGKQLNGNWLGGNKIAHHESGKVHLNDVGSKSGEQVHRAIRKHAPAFRLQEGVQNFKQTELHEHGYVGFDHKGNRHEVHSDTLYGAIKTIREKAKTPKSQEHKVHASLAERDTPQGTNQVVHSAMDESIQLDELKSTTMRSYLDKRRPDDSEGPDTLKPKNWKGIDTAARKLILRKHPVHEGQTLKTVKSVLAEARSKKEQ